MRKGWACLCFYLSKNLISDRRDGDQPSCPLLPRSWGNSAPRHLKDAETGRAVSGEGPVDSCQAWWVCSRRFSWSIPPICISSVECGDPVLTLGYICLAGKTHVKPAMPVAAPVPAPTTRHRRVYSDEGGKLSPFLPPEIFQKLQVVESQSSKK